MSDLTLRILHLFPRTLGMNGESGNVDILRRRASSRGIAVEITRLEPGVAVPLQVDLVFIGSGPVSAEVQAHPGVADVAPGLRLLAQQGIPFLAVGAGFQLLGETVTLADGTVLAGAGVFPVRTVIAGERVVGDFVVESRLGTLVGFENRGSYIDIGDAAPIGHVVYGRGNLAASGPGAGASAAAAAASDGSSLGATLVAPDARVEGFWVDNLIGTHLHGPVLANNPALADWLLETALARRASTALPPATPDLVEIDRRAAEARATIAAAPLSE
ncbi:glutamine amidotransferase [Subtercola sp. RTI3]|uniref:type 1 glutamine amidotransferase n=1 Tax=Subtercola sp. RTI3 TaxID=3048639 RepID=UPI002B23AD5A|nr:glutamine amidotransferase [Subtercola sp. RTI3]MEA9984820.1 glutamine amidotransferase [Subtercola sp. RTI3]